MFEEFSNSYYIGRLFVTPSADECPVMQQAQLERVNDELLADETELSRLDRPIVMKLGQRHFVVHGDEAVPAGTLALPESVMADASIENPPSECGVLVAKPDRAEQLMWLNGHGTNVGT